MSERYREDMPNSAVFPEKLKELIQVHALRLEQ
jgi:hypothetical protein